MNERTPGLREEELLELLLTHGLDGALERAAARGHAGAAEELQSLARFLSDCRARLAHEPEPRWVADVLARTTRQDLRLRGDVLLIARYLADSLAASPALRAAAAILLLPLLGMPVLAWLVLRPAPEPKGFLTGIEARRVEPFLPAVPDEPADEIVFVAPEGPLPQPVNTQVELVVSAPDRASAARARAASAQVQSRLRLPRPELAAQPGQLARRLDLRAALWNGSSHAPLADVGEGSEDGVLRALWVECLLDRWAREEAAPAQLDAALAALGRDASQPIDVLRLEALALDRARSFGRVDADAWGRLARAGLRPGERGSSPVDRRWRASLAAALAHSSEGRRLLGDPQLSAWLAER